MFIKTPQPVTALQMLPLSRNTMIQESPNRNDGLVLKKYASEIEYSTFRYHPTQMYGIQPCVKKVLDNLPTVIGTLTPKGLDAGHDISL